MKDYTLRILISVIFAYAISLSTAHGQANSEDDPTVPFRLERSKIIIPTSINGSKPMNLILDTGMRFDGVYLFHLKALELIDTAGAIEVQVGGAGKGEAPKATMIESGNLTFDNISLTDQPIVVSHSPHVQTFPTDGVIGWSLFGHYQVEIDYDRQLIHLRDTNYVHNDSTWVTVPVTMKENLPFLDIEVEVVEGEVLPMHVYIDLASGDALELLVHDYQKFTMPDSLTKSYLGTGISGDINGHYGKTARLQIGGYDLYRIPTAFAPAEVRSKQGGADGIIGNGLIRSFNIIFDYPRSRILIKPNLTFDLPFE
ncbi:MAG: hypothetical protein GWO41_11600 [candidate division Zixibacteria bacterium]|nr:hypothetical protein [candidate division Zixibacteria bacterium]NIR63191.1 hypothetical protein [candidate division Zixibacteria bacterium]NIS16975.1 hypothetical protein [candidate division Zixibacteria bacterium]NIS45169.1 hypothetical protein [candidate division Zixibacteria bacterium]NIT53353.1 hypothetical protein [candidate division Zixibacteria bacterium]